VPQKQLQNKSLLQGNLKRPESPGKGNHKVIQIERLQYESSLLWNLNFCTLRYCSHVQMLKLQAHNLQNIVFLDVMVHTDEYLGRNAASITKEKE
jgi:hypothetical protein